MARQLVDLLSERVRATSDSLADITLLDLGARLAKYLLREAERQGSDSVTLTLNQSELGQMIGGARQTVNQLLGAFEREGMIRLSGRRVQLVDREALRQRAVSAR
jgi:CRP/FNR family transcriptional regulator